MYLVRVWVRVRVRVRVQVWVGVRGGVTVRVRVVSRPALWPSGASLKLPRCPRQPPSCHSSCRRNLG